MKVDHPYAQVVKNSILLGEQEPLEGPAEVC